MEMANQERSGPYCDYLPDSIAISPLPLTVGSENFVCLGRGLLHHGSGTPFVSYAGCGEDKHECKFDPHVRKRLQLLKPKKTNPGKVRIVLSTIQEKPLKYWKGQCAFRKLETTGTIEDLQERLRSSVLVGMDKEIAKAEKELNEEFWKRNAVANKEKWNFLDCDMWKAIYNPERFLREKFVDVPLKLPCAGGGADDVVQLQMNKGGNLDRLKSAAHYLGLYAEATDCRVVGDILVPRTWIFIGRSHAPVRDAIENKFLEASQIRQRQLDAQAKKTRLLHDKVIREASNDTYWDVSGVWAIMCPSIESKWGWGVSSRDDCSLDIRIVHSRRLGGQMWAQFKFLAIKGVVRFLAPKSGPTKEEDEDENEDEDEEENEEKDEEENEEEDEDDDENDKAQVNYNGEDFYLGFNDIPSKDCASWKYCFRGVGPVGGEELRLIGNPCCLTFGGVCGAELTGSFESNLTGRVEFTGVKTGPGSNSPPPEWEIINYEWNECAAAKQKS